jgi:putative ABC transport system substrate-binding protein
VKRREFITLLGGAATWPLAAHAQQPTMPVIGFLNSGSPNKFEFLARAFRKGLSENGYVEGQNVKFEYRWAEGQYDRLSALAADLVRRQVTVITAEGVTSALVAKTATTTVPIVFYFGGDPVELGLVASLNRPGGNLTGVTPLNTALGPKRLELLHELVPTASTIALLVNPAGPSAEGHLRDLPGAARTIGVQLHVLRASSERDFDTVFATLGELRVGALLIGNDGFFTNRIEQLAALAIRHAVPAIYPYREFAAAGGLMSYGGSITDAYHLLGAYVGRILKGEKPADLPVQQATKIELILNLKTAAALGITFPVSLLGRADEVIE